MPNETAKLNLDPGSLDQTSAAFQSLKAVAGEPLDLETVQACKVAVESLNNTTTRLLADIQRAEDVLCPPSVITRILRFLKRN